MLQYGFPDFANAIHASDLIPLFMNGYDDAYNIVYANTNSSYEANTMATGLYTIVMGEYQDYLSSFAVYGDPNVEKRLFSPTWPLATPDGDYLTNVLQVDYDGFWIETDEQVSSSFCGQWLRIASAIMKLSSGSSGDDSEATRKEDL